MAIINASNASTFFENVTQLIEKTCAFVSRTADLTMCMTCFEIGRVIVEEEQDGKARIEYGKGVLASLSSYLNNRVGKRFSESTLRNTRKFYQAYAPPIRQTLLAEFKNGSIYELTLPKDSNIKNEIGK